MKYRIRIWTGPCAVDAHADRVRTMPAFSDVLAGTEHVHLTVQAPAAFDARMIACDAVYGPSAPTSVYRVTDLVWEFAS
jgi:hypothetical protein